MTHTNQFDEIVARQNERMARLAAALGLTDSELLFDDMVAAADHLRAELLRVSKLNSEHVTELLKTEQERDARRVQLDNSSRALIIAAGEIEQVRTERDAAMERLRPIPVNERLPDDNRVVLGYHDGRLGKIWIRARYFPHALRWAAASLGGTVHPVTHWMELPPPP